jgi:hypothetical protein
MAGETAKDKFLRFYPKGFNDPEYLRCERDYKVEAHAKWCELLNQEEFDRLLEEKQFLEICRRAVQIEAKTNLLARFEKSALHDAVKVERAAELAAVGLFDLVYGDDDFQVRFEEFATDLRSWPTRQTSPFKWTIATIFPFLALPKQHIFLKPEVTNAAAKRRHFSLNYKPEVNWLTYSCLLRLAAVLAEEVADLYPRDIIDIQSYLWVTEFSGHAP